MKIFFSVGEPSGDLHGANLIRDLREIDSDIECVGYGGPKMANAGCELLEDLTKLAVMWILHALLNIHRFWLLFRRADRYFRENKIDACVLIDYPGFNWWIARVAKKHNVPVFYYGTPQMWAWGSWRVKKMRRLVDHVLCKLPFEAEWYQQRNCNAQYIGHPYFDEVVRHQVDENFVDEQSRDQRPLVAILPGSRRQEVTKNLPVLLSAAKHVQDRVGNVRFAIASFNEQQADMAREICREAGFEVDIHIERTPELIQLSTCCMACSGSVSLELLYHEKPTVIHYKISNFIWCVQALVRRIKYITLVNLLYTDDIESTSIQLFDPDAKGAERVPFPEYAAIDDKSENIANHIVTWLTDEDQRNERIAQLVELKKGFCVPGASQAAAKYIVNELSPARRSTQAA